MQNGRVWGHRGSHLHPACWALGAARGSTRKGRAPSWGLLSWAALDMSAAGLSRLHPGEHCVAACWIPGWDKVGGKPVGREEQEMEFKAHSKCRGGCPPLPRTAELLPPAPTGSALPPPYSASVTTKSSCSQSLDDVGRGLGACAGELKGKQVLEDQQGSLCSMDAGQAWASTRT